MRVVSPNARGGRCHDALMPWLAAVGADVLCLQEVVHAPRSPVPWLRYRDDGADLPQRADLLDGLRAALPHHGLAFAPAARGPLWDGDRTHPSEWGLATAVRRDRPVIGRAQGFVHGTFGADGFGAHPRSCTGCATRRWARPTPRPARRRRIGSPTSSRQSPRRASPWSCAATSTWCRGPKRWSSCACLALTDLIDAYGIADTRTPLYPKPGRHADWMMVARADVRAFEAVAEPVVSDHRPSVLDLA